MTALLWKWNKAIKGSNWEVPFLLAAKFWAQHECHKSNCQSVKERWIWLHGKDHWLWACSRRGVSVSVGCCEDDGYVHVCLRMQGCCWVCSALTDLNKRRILLTAQTVSFWLLNWVYYLTDFLYANMAIYNVIISNIKRSLRPIHPLL